MKWLADFYLDFWYHSEFWLTPTNRRPYTFIMRDWIYRHTLASTYMIIGWFTGMIWLAVFGHGFLSSVLILFTALLTSHLIWGAKWIEHEIDKAGLVEEFTEENHKGGACIISMRICQEGYCSNCEIYKGWLNNARN